MILEDRFNYSLNFYNKSENILEMALNEVPSYIPWKKLDICSNAPINERYDNLPELTKQMIRDGFPLGLVPMHKDLQEGLSSEEVEYTFTSGTTGDRVVNIFNQSWWNEAEKVSWKLNSHTASFTYPQKEAKLASSLNVGISCEEDLPYESRIVGNKLYLNEKISLIQWQNKHYARMVAELDLFKPVILEVNPSLFTRLCYWIIDNEVDVFSPEVIIFTYEFISGIHKRTIEKVFNSPIISSYGTTETGFVMMECEDGLLHQNTEFCRIDFHPLKECFGGRELGRILVTTFNNPWNVVIKFDTGDLVRLHPSGICSCGRREGMIVEVVEGRTSNCTFTLEGGLVTTKNLDDVISKIPPIRDYNMIQKNENSYHLGIMLSHEYKGLKDDITDTLKTLYGNKGRYDIEIVENLIQGPAGKFRRTQTEFNYDWSSLFI